MNSPTGFNMFVLHSDLGVKICDSYQNMTRLQELFLIYGHIKRTEDMKESANADNKNDHSESKKRVAQKYRDLQR